jgi:NADH:ubiquinone reductase (non-electrogenic)
MPAAGPATEPSRARPRLLVLGCGFGGYSLLRGLAPGLYDTTLVTPRNFFLFTPLLPSALTGTVEPRSIVEPARRRLPHVRVLEAEAEAIDWVGRRARCRATTLEREVFDEPFDELVVAVGVRPADYGVPGVAEHAIPLTGIDDARRIRARLLECLAAAEMPGLSGAEVRRRLTFVVCGGGPTGVEAAAEIDDLLEHEARRAFPRLAERSRVVLVEASPRLLTGFDEALANYTVNHFLREGIEVRVGTPVSEVRAEGVRLADGAEIPSALVIWAGGNRPVPLVERLGLELDRRGRIPVATDLGIPGRPAAYALGDCAAWGDPPLPPTAQVAQQQGAALARGLARRARGLAMRPFRFRYRGMLAYIGAGEALADLPGVQWSGRGAWIFWRSIYITKLVSLPNKLKVLLDWLRAAVFGRDLSRF